MKNKTIKKQDVVEQEISEQEADNAPKTSYESSFESSFFYTNDKYLNSIDNDEIFKSIQKKFPNLNQNNTDSIVKKAFVSILDDEKFILEILQYYNITIYDFFKLMYKQYSSIFKGPFLKKIKNRIKDKKYIANGRRKIDY